MAAENPANQSDVAALRAWIEAECQSAHLALSGLAYGAARHDFIQVHMERLDQAHQTLIPMVGEQAAILIIADALEQNIVK